MTVSQLLTILQGIEESDLAVFVDTGNGDESLNEVTLTVTAKNEITRVVLS